MKRLIVPIASIAALGLAGLFAGGVFAVFTSQDVVPQGVQVAGSQFQIGFGGPAFAPIVVTGLFPTKSVSNTFQVSLTAASDLPGQIKLGAVANTPPTTAGFPGILKVEIKVNSVTQSGPDKTLQQLQTESPVILGTINGGQSMTVQVIITWPDGLPAVDNLYINGTYNADLTVIAEQVVS